MRRYLAPVAAILSLAVLPGLALADSPMAPHDCAKRCECARRAAVKTDAEATRMQQESDFLNTVWTHA